MGRGRLGCAVSGEGDSQWEGEVKVLFCTVSGVISLHS